MNELDGLSWSLLSLQVCFFIFSSFKQLIKCKFQNVYLQFIEKKFWHCTFWFKMKLSFPTSLSFNPLHTPSSLDAVEQWKLLKTLLPLMERGRVCERYVNEDEIQIEFWRFHGRYITSKRVYFFPKLNCNEMREIHNGSSTNSLTRVLGNSWLCVCTRQKQ